MQNDVELFFTPVIPGQPNQGYIQAHNPLGKIPALETASGDTLFDSTVICEYLDSLSSGRKILPAEGDQRFRTLTRQSLAHGICEAAVIIRYETFLRPEENQWDVWLEDQWKKIHRALAWFDANVHTLQNECDLDQITLGCAMGYLDFRTPDLNWRDDYTNLKHWYDLSEQRDSFKATLPDAQPIGQSQ